MALGRLASSLSMRFAAGAIVWASIGFGSLLALVVQRHELGLEIQVRELGALSDRKLAERLDADTRLARDRLDRLTLDAARGVASLSQRVDVERAIRSGDIVAISRILGHAAKTYGLDGMIVVDAKMRVAGADRGDLDLPAVDKALRAVELGARLRALLLVNDRDAAQDIRLVMEIPAALAAALGARAPGPLGIVAAYPTFDDFGVISGALVGHRMIRIDEPTLSEFASLTGAAIAIVAKGEVIAQGGLTERLPLPLRQFDANFLAADAMGLISRCTPFETSAQICALLPLGELQDLRVEMTRSAPSPTAASSPPWPTSPSESATRSASTTSPTTTA